LRAAARLSAVPRRHVVLIEAGPDYPSALPPDLADASLPASSHDWGLRTEPGGLDLPRARVVGGCSATNAGFWSARLARRLRRLADRLGRSTRCSRCSGPWRPTATSPTSGTASTARSRISRVPVDDLEPYPRAFVDAAVACGHAAVADHNRPGAVGVGPRAPQRAAGSG
jgi:choline dehydrogenase